MLVICITTRPRWFEGKRRERKLREIRKRKRKEGEIA
jgi:hypothetical protein